jgi:hypothetical protein
MDDDVAVMVQLGGTGTWPAVARVRLGAARAWTVVARLRPLLPFSVFQSIHNMTICYLLIFLDFSFKFLHS